MPRGKAKDKGVGSAAAPNERGIVVHAQQTRFHDLTTEAPASREVDVKDLTIAVDGRDLLVDTALRLEYGVHYAFASRNGLGKSTLLKAIAEERIPGIPVNLRCLLLGQTLMQNEDEDLKDSEAGKGTALEHVLGSDVRRQRALRELNALSKALGSEVPLDPVRAVRSVKHERLERSLKRAQLVAARRSGARGWDARADLIAMEKKVSESEALLNQKDDEIDATSIEQETKEAVKLLDEVQESLEMIDWATAETRARDILLGLRFTEERINGPFTALSGGWRMRCDLATALFQRLDLLMLDEPTNYLDLPAVIWLQEYIKEVSCTVVVVTHDRDFTDNIADELIVLRDQKLEVFSGNLSLYESERNAHKKRMTKMKEAQDKKTSHMEKSIENNLAAAKRTGDDKKLKQAKSRQRKLDDRMGLEVSAKGGRFKLNRDLAGYNLTSRAQIEIPQDDPLVRMSFPTNMADLRFPGALVSLEHVSFKYPRTKDNVLNDVSLSIHLGDRIGLCGANGSGKSTVVKLIVASENDSITVRPSSGAVTKHSRLRIGHFSQHSTDELIEIGESRKDLCALQHLLETAGEELVESKARSLLGNLGLPGRIATDIPLAALSGGQLVRLALAKLVWNPPQLLVLDEVTTHLDADTIVSLIGALKAFEGALLVVTHDRFFMRCVVEGHKADKGEADSDGEDQSDAEDEHDGNRSVYRIVKGQLRKLSGGMDQYVEIVSRKTKKT